MVDKKERILIIEDSQESIDLLYYFLEPEGYQLEHTSSGEEGLKKIKENPPDLILLDIMLPDLDGYTICKEIKESDKLFHIPVIVLTALKDLKDKIKGYEAGADDFITKPFDSIELLARVRSLLRMKKLHQAFQDKQKELEEKNLLLEKEDKLKQDLIDLIVHDMKNPLFVIQGNLQMMDMLNKLQEPKLQKYLQRIERSTRNLLRMILNLLDISRIENNMLQLQLIHFNVIEIIKNKINAFIEIGEFEGFQLTTNFPDVPFNVELDTELFGRVIENILNFLINNSRLEGRIDIDVKAGKDILTCSFYHEGSVIPEQFKTKVFEKYAQIELKKAGFKPSRGLGLIFCKIALKKMGMDIVLDENVSGGNRFIITIKLEK